MLAIMMLQTLLSPTQTSPPAADLALPDTRTTCPAAQDGTDIVVCGRRDADDRYRLKPLDIGQGERKRRAEVMLTDSIKASVEVESDEIAPRLVSKRVMVRLKMPF